jgi:hypothetical protein
LAGAGAQEAGTAHGFVTQGFAATVRARMFAQPVMTTAIESTNAMVKAFIEILLTCF